MALASSQETACQTPPDCPGATETCISLLGPAEDYHPQKQAFIERCEQYTTCTERNTLCDSLQSTEQAWQLFVEELYKNGWNNRIVNDIQWEIL